ncbi:DegT/DnrJ/EryC1/StrS family aminotransferase [Patescibacteria group bacterium]
MISGPYPRSKIYTTFNSYFSFLTSLIFFRIKKGNDVEKLEKTLAKRLNVSDAICVPMARVGIYLTLKHLIKSGKGIIMSPYTIADVVNMVICAGYVPIFCDIEQSSCNIDPNKIEKLINENTGAILITHLHGISAKTKKILNICKKYNLPLIEDTAQAFGANKNGKMLGTIGDVGIYSFGMYKNINCWYGGAIASNNKKLINNIRSEINKYNYLSNAFIFKRISKGLLIDLLTFPIFFKLITFWIFRFGFLSNIKWINKWVEIELDLKLKDKIPNHYLSRLTPWQARLVLAQLDSVETNRNNRLAKANIYYNGLKNIDELILPPNEKTNAYLVFPIQYQERNKILKWLMFNNRDIAAQHLKNCADLPSFSAWHRNCPIASKTAKETIILPTYPKYPELEVEKNIKIIKSFFNQKKET